MEKDKHKTYVRFVIFKGEVLAVFMRTSADVRCDYRGYWVRSCYARVGQHGECYDGMQKRKPATKEQYAPLAKELESLGYNLVIMNKG